MSADTLEYLRNTGNVMHHQYGHPQVHTTDRQTNGALRFSE